MFDLTASDVAGALEDAFHLAQDVLDWAIKNAVTAGDVFAVAEAVAIVGRHDQIDEAIDLLRARAQAYAPADISALAARDFARAYRILKDARQRAAIAI